MYFDTNLEPLQNKRFEIFESYLKPLKICLKRLLKQKIMTNERKVINGHNFNVNPVLFFPEQLSHSLQEPEKYILFLVKIGV